MARRGRRSGTSKVARPAYVVLVRLVGYERRLVTLVEYDAVWPEVASYIASLLATAVPTGTVEHVGSTAVPGLSGKGTIDMMVVVPRADVPAVVPALCAAGLQTRPNGFPPHRPLLFAAVEAAGRTYQVHVHVIPQDDDEVQVQRGLTVALRDDPELRAQYGALKRDIVQSGAVDPVPYSAAKDAWLARTLSRLGLPPTPEAFRGGPPASTREPTESGTPPVRVASAPATSSVEDR